MAEKPLRPSISDHHDESHVSVASTVFWLLCVVTAITTEATALLTWLIGRSVDSRPLEMIHRVALFMSLITAILGLLMVPIVLRVRDTQPPRSALRLTYAVVAIACLFAVLLK